MVIVQGVMHPAANDLYDTRIQQDFLAFALHLERAYELAREQQAPDLADYAESLETLGRGS